ncbi:beta-mannosidase [Fistulina hepatica ATCC 64428]|uniref:Beta-mannosidase B n=1 Tax=Fistulina hepatica ATCC 64428 TaxID=1128425 RepID=A0A0D7A4Y7_9AGAR|nr:beta-mannosidase [Fistulina hepatica ATCC 64428]
MAVSSRYRVLRDWSFTQLGGGKGTADGEWLQTSSFPTSVHAELLKLKRIPDPFIGLHEWDVQWIGESQWAFKTTFTIDADELIAPSIDAVFDGLDTFAVVELNGSKILDAYNQFLSYRVSVKPLLKEGTNELVLKFDSAFIVGRRQEQKHGKFKLWNGDSSRLHVRKAQYNYGWDWGPVLVTVGPWKPISLHFYAVRITDVDIRSDVAASLSVDMTANIVVSAPQGSVTLTLERPDGGEEKSAIVLVKDGKAHFAFHWDPKTLELWYPVRYGAQPLYTAKVVLKDASGNVLDIREQKIAFRRVRIVQDELVDQAGRTFLFEINNFRIFCSNWIPADSFLTNVSPERYRTWIKLLADGNQNMIRVWGGGIYEHDVFYETCDVLVWQDFMFGCGQYPAYDSFTASVELEAEQAVKRLRHHPSIVIFAGNNEDYQLAEQSHLDLDYSDETSDFRDTNFPARYIYERLLPRIVEKHSNIYYHRSSPYSGYGKPTTDQTYGDLHQWNVWHGSQEPWHNWDILAGRFVSEFGMEGFPDIRTVDYWLGGDKSERYPQSRRVIFRKTADGFERRLEASLYLVENFKHAFEMESYVYYTQIMQAETLAAAYRLWRRNWKGPGREYTAGALVWQLDDCWPTTSWAIADYFLRPKPAYFTIARELLPYTVGMTRKEKKTFADPLKAADFTIETTLEIWGTNSTLVEKCVTLEVASFDLYSNWTDTWTREGVVLAANSTTELFSGALPGQPVRTSLGEIPKTIIVSARLLDPAERTVFSRFSNWPEPFKYIQFPSVEEVALKVSVGADGETVTLETAKPVKGVVLDADGDDVRWSDQALDLVPGDPQTVKAVGLQGRKIKVRYLGDGTA